MSADSGVRHAGATWRERFLEAVIESAVDYAIIALDPGGLIVSWNAGAEQVLGWSAAEICGQPIHTFFTPEDRAAGVPEREMAAALHTGRGNDERWHLRKDGRRFWASGQMMPLSDESGLTQGFVKILRDRTPQREAEQRLRASEAFLRTVLDSSADCIKVLDLDSRLRFMNEGGRRIMEVDDFGAVEGCPWADFLGPELQPELQRALAEARAGGTGRFTGFAATAKGSPRWWSVQVTPIRDGNGDPERLLSISRDISEEHRGRAAAETQVARLAILSKVSDQLISGTDPDEVVAHLFQAIAAQLELDTCFHFGLDDGSQVPRLQNHVGITADQARSLAQLDLGGSVCGTVARTGEPLYLADIQHSPDPTADLPRGLGLCALACNPLRAGTRVLGTLLFGSRRRRTFSEEDLSFLRTVTNHVAAIKERNRAEAALRSSEARWRGLFERMQEAVFIGEAVRDAAGRIEDIRFVEMNPAFENVTGLQLAATTGRTIREAIPTIQDELIETYAGVIETGEPATFEICVAELGHRWYEARARRDEANRLVVLFLDITERKRAAEALAASEQRSRLAQEAGHVGMFEIDVETGVVTGSDEFFRLWGLPLQGSIPVSELLDMLVPEDRVLASSMHGLRQGQSATDVEYRVRRADTGEVRWLARKSEYFRDAQGRPTRLIGTIHDVTAMKEAEGRRLALIELGDRLRDLTSTADMAYVAAEIMGRSLRLSRAGYGNVEPHGETVTIERDWSAAGIESLAGTLRFDDYGPYVARLKRGDIVVVDDVRQDPRTVPGAAAFEALGIRSLVNLPLMEHGRFVALFYLNQSEPRAWKPEELVFVQNVADRTRAAVARLRAEERQKLLNQELSHRLKNTLAMAQAIAAQTLRNAPDIKTAERALADRMIALSRAHDLLLKGEREAADARDLILGAIEAHGGGPDRVRLSGPPLIVGSRAALSLALMLHELATNAVKYGALSTPSGQVEVAWSIAGEQGNPFVLLTWTERGGPPVTGPARRGFGSRLIERGLAGQIGGEAKLSYEPAGLVCTLKAPLAAFQLD